MYIYSARPSEGAAALARELGIKKARANGPMLRGTLINWGNTELPNRFRNCEIINKPEDVEVVSNKLTLFQHLATLGLTPSWTVNKHHAEEMIGRGDKIVCRTMLRASGGAGIVIAETPEQLVNAPLYVRYQPKDEEFRIHVFNNTIIDRQRKARRREVPDNEINWRVRNLEGGFIYARNDIAVPGCVDAVALECMSHLNLDFGAVDVIYHRKKNRAWVLEVNSAPGLEGTTVVNYANAFRREYM